MTDDDRKTIANLRAGLDAMHGRMNGMLMALVTLTRVLTPAQAAHASRLLSEAAEHVAADAVASSMADAAIEEQERVIEEFVRTLDAAATLTDSSFPRFGFARANR